MEKRRHWSGFTPNSKFTQYNFHYACNLVLHNALWVTPSSFFFFSMVGKGFCITTGTKNENIFSKIEGKRRHEKQETGEKKEKTMEKEEGEWRKKHVSKESERGKIFKKRSQKKMETLKRWIKLRRRC